MFLYCSIVTGIEGDENSQQQIFNYRLQNLDEQIKEIKENLNKKVDIAPYKDSNQSKIDTLLINLDSQKCICQSKC